MASPPASDPSASDLPPSDLTEDAFLGGRLRLLQPARGFRSGHEAVLLAASVEARAGESALELGAGAGAAILALGARVPGLRLAGLELQPAYARLARANAERNGLALEVWEGDVAAPPAALHARAFDHVLMNPPFFDRARSSPAPEPGRDRARGGADLPAWTELAARRLAPGGRLHAIMDAARLPALLASLPATLGSPEVRPLASRDGPARLILLRARKGGRASFRLLPPMPLRQSGGPSPIAEAVLREGAPLPWI
jgi:tRNA1Val (adenine37-N6)-methyltransferase